MGFSNAELREKVVSSLTNTSGIRLARVQIKGSAMEVVLVADASMCSSVHKDLYTSAVGHILQEAIDESDGEISVEYATVKVLSEEDDDGAHQLSIARGSSE